MAKLKFELKCVRTHACVYRRPVNPFNWVRYFEWFFFADNFMILFSVNIVF